MANDVICHMIFENPVTKNIKKVYFDLPNRSYAEYLSTSEVEEYKQNAYGLGKAKDNKDIVYITSKEVYRAAIERELFHSDNRSIDVSGINVRPIPYSKFSDEDEVLNAGFLYLSDLLCAATNKDRYGNKYKITDITKLPERLDTVCGKDVMTFFYDTTDSCYLKAFEAIRRKDYKDALDWIYNGENRESECRKYYRDKWFPILIEKMKKEVDTDTFTDAVRKLKAYSYSNNIEQEKLAYLVEKLEEISECLEFHNDEQKVVLYDFYQIAAAACNHLAGSLDAKKYFNKAERLIKYISLEERLALINKEVVSMCDSMEYDAALRWAEKSRKTWDEISAIRKNDYGEDYESLGMRKSYSQLGQVYAFLGDSRAENVFKKSIGNSDDPNTFITMSYLLHYYSEQGMQNEYDGLAKRYFGGNELLTEQLKYIIKDGAKGKSSIISLKFALYVYVKGIYRFHMQDVVDDNELKSLLLDINTTVESINKEAVREINGHPWEIIYKYLALISCKCDDNIKSEAYIRLSEKILVKNHDMPEALLNAIIAYGRLEYLECSDSTTDKEINKAMDLCWGEIRNISLKLDKDYKDTSKRTRDNLRQLMTYMYH